MQWRKLTCGLGLVLAGMTGYGQGLIYNLLMPTTTVSPGTKARIDLLLLNAATETADYGLPSVLAGRLLAPDQSWPVELRSEGAGFGRVAPNGFAHHAYTFAVPAAASGSLILELERPATLRGLIEVAKASAAGDSPEIAGTPLSNIITTRPAASAVKRAFAGRFSPHEPIYFLYGNDTPAAKFQFSFKYRLLGDSASLGEAIPALQGLYLGYTQRSLWDVNGDSSPFYDTSYMPELIYESQTMVDPGGPGGMKWLGYQVALKHESNGRAGLDSRSVNIGYVRAALAFGRLDGWNVLVIPRLFTYVSDLSNNPDIANYRGNADLVVVVGRNNGAALSLTGQMGRGGHKGSLQADLSIPVKFDRLFDFATYLLVQYWDGYGEDLLQYNQRSSSLRFGFSLVR